MPTSSMDLHSVSQSPIMQSMSQKGCPMQLVAGWAISGPSRRRRKNTGRRSFALSSLFLLIHQQQQPIEESRFFKMGKWSRPKGHGIVHGGGVSQEDFSARVYVLSLTATFQFRQLQHFSWTMRVLCRHHSMVSRWWQGQYTYILPSIMSVLSLYF